MIFTCPVCGYDALTAPPENHTICVCCGTQFDYHDCTTSHAQLRQRWIEAGAVWHSRRVTQPLLWSASEQLLHIGYVCTPQDLQSICVPPSVRADRERMGLQV